MNQLLVYLLTGQQSFYLMKKRLSDSDEVLVWIKAEMIGVNCDFLDFQVKTKKRSAIIRNNRNYFLENIQLNDDLLASLLTLDCITEKQKHLIQRHRLNEDKNAELLYAARTFDETKFSNFVKCLRRTKQNMVARITENGGGLKYII